MGIGPFTTYAPPNVYTQTVTEPPVGQLLGGVRIPVLIGVGKESLSQTNFEMIRGSSSVADTLVSGEDASGRWVSGGTDVNPILGNQDGSKTRFRVRNYPVVDGTGRGVVTYDATKVSVTVNNIQVVVSALNGAFGYVDLLVPPSVDDVVLITYYFHRSDTRTTDDVSAQVTTTVATLVAPKTEFYSVVLGSSDKFDLTVDDRVVASITLTPGTRAAADVANDINQATISGLTSSVHVDADGKSHVQIVARGNLLVGSGNANGILGFNPGDSTNRARVFTVFNGPIVDGSGGGITTTDPSKVVVQVNGQQVLARSVDGKNSTVTLPYAPYPSSLVTIQYYFNTFQDTFDYLPNSGIVSVGNVGISPGRTDYLNGPDFIIVNDRDQSRIQWGTAFQVVAGIKTGNTAFDSVQISGSLIDDRIYAAACERYSDPLTNAVSTSTFVLPLTPTTGNGRDTPLGQSLYQTITNGRIDLPTNRPDLVEVFVGKTLRDALSRPSVTVLEVDSTTNTFTVRDPVPADYQAFATFWYNRLVDDQYTFSVITSGPAGVGTFTVTSQKTGGQLFNVLFGVKHSLPQTVQFPSGSEDVPDAFVTGAGNPTAETVTVAFSNALAPATHASITNARQEPYDIYNYSRIFGGIVIDGNTPVSVDLTTAFVAQLLGSAISPSVAPLSTDVLVLVIDGVQLPPIDVSAAATLANIATFINAAVDADVQTHADGSATFASTSPNNLATVLTFGSQSILKIKGRNVPSFTNGLSAQVKVLTPVLAGETDASYKVGLVPNQESLGSYNAIDQVATVVGTQTGPFNVQVGANDVIQLNVDGADISATLPAGAAVPLADVVTNINDAYIAVASAADIATYTTDLIGLSNNLRTKYESHRVSTVFHLAADTTNAITASTATDLPTAILLINDIKSKLNAHFTQSGVHQLNDTVNTVTTGNATNLQSAVILANDLKENLNHHLLQQGVHGYDDIVNTLTPAAPPTTNVQCYPILNDIKVKLNAHFAQTGVHIINDVVNTITAPDAFSQISGEALANQISSNFNAHIASTVYHPVADTTNVITAAPANSPSSLVALTVQLQANYPTHLLQTQGIYHVHGTNDTVNTATASMSELVARSGHGTNAGKLILTSRVNTAASALQVKQLSTAAQTLGFIAGSLTQRSQPTSARIAGALNSNSGFLALAVAYAVSVSGLGNYLSITSRSVGNTSTVSFTSVANSALIADTGLGIVPGTTGDIGENARSGFTVASSQGLLGSHGEGFPGQTYTDDTTGLRFTILPASAGDYADGGSFTFNVSQTFTANAAIPMYSIPGLQTLIYNTVNMNPNTTAVLTTYARSGSQPAIGDVYYISYEYAKSDLSTQLYRELRKIQQSYGPPTPDFPLSLAARIALLNGAVIIGLKQVPKAPGSSQGSIASYTAAIDELKKPIAGSVLPDVITPLITDPQVSAYLNQHCAVMSSPRMAGERTGIVGTAAGTTPLGVQSIVKALNSQLIIVVYPDSYVISVQDDLGVSTQQLVDGTYMASAIAGTACNPAFDSATPLTRRSITQFTRLGRVMDPTEADQVAVSGVTIIEQVDSGMRVRHGLTTDVSNVLTRTPSVVWTIQFVQQSVRATLDPYIGQKLTGNLIKSIENGMVGMFQQLIDKEIVNKVGAIDVAVDDQDPTIVRASAIYIPVFPLEYIVVSLSLRVRS